MDSITVAGIALIVFGLLLWFIAFAVWGSGYALPLAGIGGIIFVGLLFIVIGIVASLYSRSTQSVNSVANGPVTMVEASLC